jgi:hypothetical protein
MGTMRNATRLSLDSNLVVTRLGLGTASQLASLLDSAPAFESSTQGVQTIGPRVRGPELLIRFTHKYSRPHLGDPVSTLCAPDFLGCTQPLEIAVP